MRFILIAFLLSSALFAGDHSLRVRGVERPSETVELSSHGRGIAVSKRHCLTARHVLTNTSETNFRTPEVMVDGKWIAGKVAGHDAANDLALIELPEDVLKPVDLLSIPELHVHGSPGLQESRIRPTTIQAFKTYVKEIKDLDAPQDAGGLSGSPLLADGHLIGIVSSAGRDQDGIFIIIIGPEPIKQLVSQHLKKD